VSVLILRTKPKVAAVADLSLVDDLEPLELKSDKPLAHLLQAESDARFTTKCAKGESRMKLLRVFGVFAVFAVGWAAPASATSILKTGDTSIMGDWLYSNFPGFQHVEICGYAGNDCAGGGNNGQKEGQAFAADAIISLIFGSVGKGILFGPGPVKFQNGIGSFKFDSTFWCQRGNCDTRRVPEPASLTLLVPGLALLLAKHRRRRSSPR
jgi:hypothetical protein